ncbi:MAG: hypothetical protein JXR83_02980 [Deltaproteobacteria bacterium]|nr:hypothetical protein [Deltaproteobacteria bacterium]
MSVLKSNPKVEQFVSAWTTRFARAVRDAAGEDGKLTLAEARTIAQRDGVLRLYGDNAVNYLEAKGLDEVKVNTLIGAGRRYVQSAANRVAGSNHRISLAEARLLPKDLIDEFFTLRGKKVPNLAPKPDPEPLRFDVSSDNPALKAEIADDLIKLVDSGAPVGAKLTLKFDGHEVTFQKYPGGFGTWSIGRQMPEGYGASEVTSTPPTVRIVKDPAGTPSTSEALAIAREGIAEYIKTERVNDRDWQDYFGSTWDDAVSRGVTDGIARFGTNATGDLDITRSLDGYIFCDRGPFDLYTEVYVDKASKKVTRVYVEID